MTTPPPPPSPGSYPTPPPSDQPYPQPSPPQKPRWPWMLLAGVFGLFAVLSNLDPPAASPTSADAAAAQPESGLNLSQKAIPDFEAWQARNSAPAPTGPVTTFGEGTFEVGTDIEPGTYKTAGPASGWMKYCYWERQSATDGEFSSIIANEGGEGPTTVTISPNDAAFKTSGCEAWMKVR